MRSRKKRNDEVTIFFIIRAIKKNCEKKVNACFMLETWETVTQLPSIDSGKKLGKCILGRHPERNNLTNCFPTIHSFFKHSATASSNAMFLLFKLFLT